MRRMSVPGGLAGIAVIAGVAGLSAGVRAEDLPTDPRLVTGELDNGLRYIVMKHSTPAHFADLWLHVSSGSLNETDAQRGIAHYLEHMAFNGSKNFEAGKVVPFFESLGLKFGRDQNAFTSFDQTSYNLELKAADPEMIEKGLMFLSDVAGRLTLAPVDIDDERKIILEEKRARSSGRQRVGDVVLEKIAPGSLVGKRLPIGTEETVNGVKEEDFKAYYGAYYVPSNMTVIVVGDAETGPVVEAIKEKFSGGERKPRPRDQDAKVKAPDGVGAIVASDPELNRAQIAITTIGPARPPTTTVEAARRDLVEEIGRWVFNRRLEARVAAGKASFLGGGAGVSQIEHALRQVQAGAAGEAPKWRDMLSDLATELQRQRLNGVTDRELDDARRELLSAAERQVETEPTVPSGSIIRAFNDHVNSGEPIMSAPQELALYKKLLPTITRDEVSAAFSKEFDPTAVMFVLTMPSGEGVPSEADLISVGKAALDVKPQAEAEEARATELMAKALDPAAVTDAAEHAGSKVVSAWLGNGARVHYRFMDDRKDQATITITLAGGEIAEKAENRGVTSAAAVGFETPATATLTSTQIRDLMTGKKVAVGGGAGRDTMSVVVSGSPAELEQGLQLAHLLLSEPVIEKAAFDQWRRVQLQQIEARAKDPQQAFRVLVESSLYPAGEARLLPITAEQVGAVTLSAAQAWLKKNIASAPIEVSVVGEIEKEKAMDLVARYVGSLPGRERITDATLASLRTVARPTGPITRDRTMATKTPAAVVMSGFFGADSKNVADVRRLELASQVLSTRMNKQIREADRLVYSISARNQPGREYPGYGRFIAVAPTDPAKPDALKARIDEMYDAFAKDGPTDEELTVAKNQAAKDREEQMKQPAFWTAVTGDLDYRGRKLDDVMSAAESYEKFTAGEVRETFAKYYKPEARFEFVLKPEDSAGSSPAPAGGDKDKPADGEKKTMKAK